MAVQAEQRFKARKPSFHKRAEIRQPVLSRLGSSGWPWALLLVALTFATYFPVLSHPFVNYDDPDYVTENRHVQQGLDLSTAQWALLSTEQGNWHPVTWLSHALDCELYGLEPGGHHFSSLLLHSLNAGMLFVLLAGATGLRARSFLVAALFALHPMNVESVAWIAERKTVLSMFFFLLATAAYGWYARKPGALRYLLVFLCSNLALSSKPMVVTLPFMFLLLDFWPLQRVHEAAASDESKSALTRVSFRRLVIEKLPLFALAVASSVITLIAQKKAIKTVAAVPFSARVANAIYSYSAYLWKAAWPLRLGVFYAHRGSQLAIWQVASCIAFLALVSALVWKAKSHEYLPVGWFWYLGTLVPMIGLIQAGEQGMADRYAYLPLLGIFVLLVWGISDLACRFKVDRRITITLAVLLVSTLALLTRRQLKTWESSFALWTHSLEITSENYVAEDFVGSTLLDRDYQSKGEPCSDEALQHFERAVQINTRDSLGHLNVGFCRQARGDFSAAVSEFHAALESAPNRFLKSRAYLNLGAGYDSLGDFAKAHEFLNHAAEISPRDADIQAGFAQLEGDEKIAEKAAALVKSPSTTGYVELGELQERMGHSRDASASYRRALDLDPKSVAARDLLNALSGGKR